MTIQNSVRIDVNIVGDLDPTSIGREDRSVPNPAVLADFNPTFRRSAEERAALDPGCSSDFQFTPITPNGKAREMVGLIHAWFAILP